MRSWWVAMVAFALLECGCGTRFFGGPLRPAPRSAPAAQEIYAQVRELAVAVPWYWLRSDVSREVAVTVDLRNDSNRPLVLDLPRATLRIRDDGKQDIVADALAAGQGNLPRYVRLRAGVRSTLALAPRTEQTVWLAFESPAPPDAPAWRMVVVVPVLDGDDVAITLDDRRYSPAWAPAVTTLGGLSLVASASRLGRGSDTTFFASPYGLSLWLARGPFRFSTMFTPSISYERSSEGISRTDVGAIGLDVAWRPVNWTLGAYVSGQLIGGRPDADGGLEWRQAVSAGLIVPFQGGIDPILAMRIGYTRLFGSRAGSNGISVTLEGRLLTF